MKRLDPSSQHLGKAGDIADLSDRQARLDKRFVGAARGNQLRAVFRQKAPEVG